MRYVETKQTPQGRVRDVIRWPWTSRSHVGTLFVTCIELHLQHLLLCALSDSMQRTIHPGARPLSQQRCKTRARVPPSIDQQE